SIAEINNTMRIAWGGSYINDFVDRGRVKKVYVQGDAGSRMMPEDLNKWYVRNNKVRWFHSRRLLQANGRMVLHVSNVYNGVSSVNIQGTPAPGVSSGDAMKQWKKLLVSIAEINNTMRIAWGGSYINDFVDRGRVKKVYVQ
ncbi:hypothetical protein EDM35_15685, partial [Staphylococcus aureus]|uniref:efflux RND transporter permease subunit n=1 Tax=Staphylococcus aureus TaxID=1280 RepID=UPI000F3C6A9B